VNVPSTGLVVVAAGVGSRLGGAVHKALVTLEGRPLVEHTLRRLLAVPWLDPVVCVGHADDRQALGELLADMPRAVDHVDGGARRQDSVAAGLAALDNRCEVVFVHDAARPFVPLDALEPLRASAASHGCALLAVPVADTLKAVPETDTPSDRQVERTVPRAGLWAAQTPQAFRTQDLSQALQIAAQEGRTVTDEAALFEAAGRGVRIVEGSRVNFKITTAEDLALARALLATEGKGGEP